MIFASPTAQDMITIRETLAFFGNASGLHTNLQKSLIAPIACTDEQVQRISTFLLARISEFPIQYLDLPLTVGRLRIQKGTLAATGRQSSSLHPDLESFTDERSRPADNGKSVHDLNLHSHIHLAEDS